MKDRECERLSQVRTQLEQELEELTASLFEVSDHLHTWPPMISDDQIHHLHPSENI